MEISMMKITK